MPPRRARLAALLLAGSFAGACSGRSGDFERFVLVTFDTTRADHLGAYGYPRATSPFFDRLAARGVLFERAIAPMPVTVPSHAAMFTSRYPIERRLGHNGIRVPGGVPTAAELFRARGFATAGFASAAYLANSGLGRGFEHFEAHQVRGPGETSQSGSGEPETTAAAIEWLRRQRPGTHFFVWVHFFDPHTPYSPHPAPLLAVRRESGEIAIHRDLLVGPHGIRLGVHGGDFGRMLETVERYDAELRAMDGKLARLYGAFEELGIAERTAWIVAGDHGEGLGSHDWLQHGVRIYQEQMRVPLLFHSRDRRWPARRVSNVVELVDLLPTLAELARLTSPPETRGVSLVPFLVGGRPGPVEREAFIERRTFTGSRPAPDADPALAEKWEDGIRAGLVGERWKYIYWTAGPAELYDLASDPTESRNLAAERPEIANSMRNRLLRRVRALRAEAPPPESVDERTLELLRSLGYLQ